MSFLNMRPQLSITAISLISSLCFASLPAFSETRSNENLKVLARDEGGFNVSAVQELLNNDASYVNT